MVEDIEVHGDGHVDEESIKRAQELAAKYQHEDGIAGNMTLTQLSLLQKMLTAPENIKELQIFLIADFLDDEEARNCVDAYFEAKELGMDSDYNVAYLFALCATNRKGNKSNRIAMLLDSLQHVKYTSNVPKEKRYASRERRGPLD